MAGGVIHLHPLSRCNLRCVHCYSAALPERAEYVSPEELVTFSRALLSHGYDTVSISGGEPTLYAELTPLVLQLCAAGFAVNLVSNGLRARPLLELAQAGWRGSVAISFDGLAATHDRIRLREGAFERGLATLAQLQAAGMSVGASVCVSSQSFTELPDLAECLVEAGARFIQMHPLTRVGRAREQNALALGGDDLPSLLLLSGLFARQWPHIGLRADVACRLHLRQQLAEYDQRPYATIVVDEHGRVFPICYGIGQEHQLGTIKHLDPARLRLSSRLRQHLAHAYQGDDYEVIDPYGALLAELDTERGAPTNLLASAVRQLA